MGLKGFYGFCKKEIADCYKLINIAVEIKNFKEKHEKSPLIVINLNTLCHHFRVNKTDLLCGYQLNKIKYILEEFFSKLKKAGGELIFIWHKAECGEEFLSRRLQDYKGARNLGQKIKKIQSLEKLLSTRFEKIPYNILILVCMIQSAKKFGKTFQIGSFYPQHTHSIAQAEFASIKNATWLMGLDTNYFFMPGEWKILSDESLNINKLTIHEFDKKIIMRHLGIDHQHFPLFATLSEFKTESAALSKKVVNHFGFHMKFMNVAKFIQKIKYPLTNESYVDISKKIFGDNYDQHVIKELKKSVDNLTRSTSTGIEIESPYADLFKDDFPSYAYEILCNKPIFVTPAFLDLQSPEMMDFNSLVLPWIQKTAGILLKNSDDKEDREIILLKYPEEKFVREKLEVIYPLFKVPELKSLIGGEISTYEKMSMLFWIMDIKLDETEMPVLPEEYMIDSLILIYLVKKNSLTVLDSRCILKTLIDSRQKESLQYSTDYPLKVNSRALRCTFLYCKLYFILHSCLACLGMKNLCPEIQFDGVYFQKIYALNVLQEDEEEIEDGKNENNNDDSKDCDESEIIPNDSELNQTEIIDMFARILIS